MRRQRGRQFRSWWRRVAVLAAASGLVLTVRTAGAASASEPTESSPAVALAWTGPGRELACLGEDGLTRAVNEYLGRDAFASGALEYVLAVNVERLPDRRFRAVLELRDASGRVLGARELRSATDLCSDLDEPLVLAVALMVDVQPEPAPAPPPREAEPEPEPESEPEPDDPGAAPVPARAEPLAVLAGASLALEAGLLPAPRPGLLVGAELRAVSWLSARISGFGFLPASEDVPGGGSARFLLVGGMLELCPGFVTDGSVRLSFCGGALYGAMNAQSTGLAGARSTWQRLLAGAFGPKVAVPLGGRWFGLAGLTGVVPLRPDRYVYEVGAVREELFQSSSFSILASAGVEVMF